jgi:hypothetical protein
MATEKISGTALASIGVGSLFVWAALSGKSMLATIQALIKGESPNLLTNSKPIAEAPQSQVFGSSNSSTITNVGGTNNGPPLTDSNFIAAVLAGIGAPNTPANQQSMSAWIRHEGGGGKNNPLNTTEPEPGATDFNSVGVKNYVSGSQGVEATIATLMGGGYSDVVGALRSGNGLCGQAWFGLSRWSGGGYSQVC